MVDVGTSLVGDPRPFRRVHDHPLALDERPSAPGVDHEQTDPPDVADVGPAVAAGILVGGLGELVEDGTGVAVAGLHAGPQLVLRERVGREVPEMLVDPVGPEGADDPVVPPRQLALGLLPRQRGVPVVGHVVIVEDHRRGHRGEQPAQARVQPRDAVQPRELLEVGELVLGRARPRSLAPDDLADLVGHLVGVDLVPGEEEQVGQSLQGRADRSRRARGARRFRASAG
jgi:hypothetical protein